MLEIASIPFSKNYINLPRNCITCAGRAEVILHHQNFL